MKFAQFQSTYKPLPISTYERTGELLESKYYRNREQSSLLRQAMANVKVEDRNIGHLAKATTDVENMLNEVNGKWHYASNILYNAKDRLTNDKALNASMEDYAKEQATKQDVQKQFEEGKIDKKALDAFYTNTKRYNTKAIELDENGQAINRWAAPVPPPKVDTEKKVLEIVTLLNQHADTLAMPGTDIMEIYKSNGNLRGYVDLYTNKGKDPNKLGEAVKAWINSTPEVKQYYDYINDSEIFNAVTERDEKGNYLQDEYGDFIQKDLTPSDFRALGIDVDDKWNTWSNKVHLPGINGIITSMVVKAMSPNLKETGLYGNLREQGLSDREAVQQMYKKVLTDLDTDKIVNFGRQFGYNEIDHKVIKDEMFFYNMARADKLRDDQDFYYVNPGLTTNVKLNDYNATETQDLLGKLIEERSSINVDPITRKNEDYTRYNQLDYEIKNIRNQERILRSSYLKSVEGGVYADELFKEFTKNARNKIDRDLIIKNKDYIIKYISGQTEDVNSTLPKYLFEPNEKETQDVGFLVRQYKSDKDLSVYTDSDMARTRKSFNYALTKAIQEKGVKVSYETAILTDSDGKPSKLIESLNNFAQTNASEFSIKNQATKYKDGRENLGQVISQDLQDGNPALYNFNLEVPKGQHNGTNFFLRITPKNKEVTPLEQDTYIIEPNVGIRFEFMNFLANVANSNVATGEANDWVQQTVANNMYRHYFEEIENTLARAREFNPNVSFNDIGEQYFTNVPWADGNRYNFKLTSNPKGGLLLYQTDVAGIPQGVPSIFDSLESVENYFKDSYFSNK